MGNAWNDLHKDLGVSARMRAVMESIGEGKKTVPAIASEKEVSRQHIQTIVNELLAAGLVRKMDNPDHKRSPLISLTESGATAMAQITKREADLMPKIASELKHLPLATTADVLEELLRYFSSDFPQHFQEVIGKPKSRRKNQ